MSRARRVSVATPAKVNLGLEVVARRPDGYHEIVSVMQAVSVFDTFTWEDTGQPFEYTGIAEARREDDLIARALALAPEADRERWTGRLSVAKRIPAAAGLGGGSSDAALALRLALPEATGDALVAGAARLGSDVPFFVRGGTALATGIGVDLDPLPTPRLWFVLVTPPLVVASKTQSLYKGLDPLDFTDGSTTRAIAGRLRAGESPGEELPNAFKRQVMSRAEVRYAYDRLLLAGSSVVSISGAGPTVYAVTGSCHEAFRIALRLPGDIGAIHVARSVASRDQPSRRVMSRAMRGTP